MVNKALILHSTFEIVQRKGVLGAVGIDMEVNIENNSNRNNIGLNCTYINGTGNEIAEYSTACMLCPNVITQRALDVREPVPVTGGI